MSKPQKPKHFLREWRKYRGLTQERLAELVHTSKSVISLLESGHRGLSDKWLRRLAPHLKTSPGTILDRKPETFTFRLEAKAVAKINRKLGKLGRAGAKAMRLADRRAAKARQALRALKRAKS